MSFSQTILKFIAARFHVPGDALDRFFASGRIGRGAETRLPFPAELIPIGARLVMRGWANNEFFPSNRDWILPYWAERQFDPRDPGFIPRGFNLYTINYTHRDWTMIGNRAREREAIVDPRGLVTPWLDGWSLDVWLAVDGKLYAPSRLPDDAVVQSLHENLPIIVTIFRAGDLRVRLESFAVEESGEWIVENITVENPSHNTHHASLYLAIRPFNPEGVSLVSELERREGEKGNEGNGAFLVNHALGVILPPPDAVACSNLANGDVALALPNLNNATQIHCDAGLGNAIAAYHLELGAGESKTLTAQMPMTPSIRADNDDDNAIRNSQFAILDPDQSRANVIATWREQLNYGMRVRLPDEHLQNAFDANKAFLLLLHDGQTITPGPFTYHQFWMRDAAYLLNALDKLGYHDQAEQVIERFARRVQKDGFFNATEGEWDSNGAAIWTMLEHARLSGDTGLLSGNYWMILRLASWINSKRQTTKDKERKTAHYGLFPPGPSAEHLGPSDFFYWDNFWGLAGLRDAALIAEWLQQENDAKKLRANFDAFRADLDASLATNVARLGRAAMPASPYRRLDAAMIGSLVALHPLHLFAAHDPRIVDTLTALHQVAWMEDAYFNHVGHSAFGTYLSLHVAQCLLLQRNPDAWKTINWVLRHASPTFTWAEGIHPLTRRGGMGDGHHGWAVADFLLAVRNALLFEEDKHLVITPALPEDWTAEMNVIQVRDAPTYFGNVSFTIAFGERTATLVVNAVWRDAPEYIEWNLPFTLREVGGDEDGIVMDGKTVRLPRGARRVVAMW
ncbi:MAG: hypothetical protein HY868_11960 [Chloroflexi bacterium]|nr:hypothetical protein [Chloroflexota bacterium]